MARKVGGPKTLGPTCDEPTPHGPCKQPAGNNTPHLGYGRCSTHRGKTPGHIRHWERVLAEQDVQRAIEEFGLEVETTANDALMGALARAQGMVLFYRERVRRLPEDQMVYGRERITRTQKQSTNLAAPGTVVEDTTTVRSVPNVWVKQLEGAERHLVAVASKVAELHIEERRVALAKEQGEMCYRAMSRVMAHYGIPEDDPDLPVVLGQVIAMEMGDGSALDTA